MVPNQPRHHLDRVLVEPDATRELRGVLRADLGMVAGQALPDVVGERAEQQQLRAGASRDLAVETLLVEDAGALHYGFEQMPVDGEAVVRVALRPRPHVLPLGQQPHECTDVVERFEHCHLRSPRTQEPEERGAVVGAPRRRCRRQMPIRRA